MLKLNIAASNKIISQSNPTSTVSGLGVGRLAILGIVSY
jgi:hypothetical protein